MRQYLLHSNYVIIINYDGGDYEDGDLIVSPNQNVTFKNIKFLGLHFGKDICCI